MPNVLDCGGCLVGDTKVWSIQCFNLGGEGKFKLLLHEGGAEGGDEGGEETDDNTVVCL